MAFAQLAEECRRNGEYDEAVRICQAGLPFHPDYLTARVTLGRALTELGRLDDAQIELQLVLAKAADNLAANRAMAEIHQQRGDLTSALPYYKKALELARYDPELESAVTRIEHVISPPAKPEPEEQAPTSIEDLFDFDTLLSQLGAGATPPEDPQKTEAAMPVIPAAPVIDPLAGIELPADDADPLARLERQLREIEEQRPYAAPVNGEDRQHAQRVLSELEDWLMAIVTDRDQASA